MICQTWPRVIRAATTGLANGPRRASSSKASSGQHRHKYRQPASQAKTSPAQTQWPLLKRRSNPSADVYTRHAKSAPTTKLFDVATTTVKPDTANRSHLMLTINGLSPNLKASDFARLSSTELSAWQHTIKKVQQQRHPDTYEPLGRYTITFSTAEAAAAYQAKLLRLHALAQHKAQYGEQTWQSSVPETLLETDSTHDSLEEQVSQYAIVLGTQQQLDIHRSRVAVSKPWATKLSALVEGDGYGEHPHLVMLDVSPPVVSADELFDEICRDAETRGTRWGVSRPHSLAPRPPPEPPAITTSETTEANDAESNPGKEDDQGAEQPDLEPEPEMPRKRRTRPKHNQFIQEMLNGRFIVSCSGEAEARRFHRFWNTRQLRNRNGHSGGRCIVRARLMEW